MDILEKLAGRVDAGEVVYIEKTSKSVSFKGWKIRGSESTQERGWAVRVIKDGKIGISATTDENAVDDMIENAIKSAEYGEQIEIEFPKKADSYPSPQIFDTKIRDVDIPKLADFGRELIANLEKYRGECDSEIEVSSGVVKFHLANTSGFDGEYEKSSFALSSELMRVKGNDIYMAWDFFLSPNLPGDITEPVSKIVGRIDEIMRYADQIVPLSSGQIPVVFSPYGAFVLFMPLNAGLNGENIYTKTSPIYDKLGEKLFDDKLTVTDDGTLDGRVASAPFDDEGVPKKKLPLVENGVLKNFLFDLATAKKSGYQTNGCAQRSLFSSPSPGTSNIIVAGGDTPLEDIIADIKEGLVVESVLGLGQGNILSGAFSNPVATGFKIENGKIVGRVKNVAIAGNIYENLKQITAISKEQKWVYGSYLVPYIRLDNVSVVSK